MSIIGRNGEKNGFEILTKVVQNTIRPYGRNECQADAKSLV